MTNKELMKTENLPVTKLQFLFNYVHLIQL